MFTLASAAKASATASMTAGIVALSSTASAPRSSVCIQYVDTQRYLALRRHRGYIATQRVTNMRRGVAIAVVCLCLLSAGCTGLFGDNAAARETVTPAPVPTAVAPAVRLNAPRASSATASSTPPRSAATTSGGFRTPPIESATPAAERRGLHRRVRTRASISAGYESYTATRTISGQSVTAREIPRTWRDGRDAQTDDRQRVDIDGVVADSRGIGGPPRSPRPALFFAPTSTGVS